MNEDENKGLWNFAMVILLIGLITGYFIHAVVHESEVIEKPVYRDCGHCMYQYECRLVKNSSPGDVYDWF